MLSFIVNSLLLYLHYDKHRVKVGESGSPVATVECGRRVLVSGTETFQVSDHSFCKFSVVPSVAFEIDISKNLEDSWYRGMVHTGYKDTVYESSSPLRHATELYSVLQGSSFKPIMFIYTDGGPDHTLQKQMGNSNPFFGVKILATQITHSLSWNDSGIVAVEIPSTF